MPRRNNHKNLRRDVPLVTVPFSFDRDYKVKCSGCAFARYDSVCLTSDGKCLKLPPTASEVKNAETDRRTDSTSAKR